MGCWGSRRAPPSGRLSELGRSSQGRRCGGWAGGQSASSRQSPGDRGQRQEGAWGAGQRGSGGREGGIPGLQHRQGPRVPCLVREPGLPLPPRPRQRRGEAGVHLRAGVYSRRMALAALSGRGQCFRARRGGLSIPADAGSLGQTRDRKGGSLRATTGLERRDLEEDA